jgi:hypothetical protein
MGPVTDPDSGARHLGDVAVIKGTISSPSDDAPFMTRAPPAMMTRQLGLIPGNNNHSKMLAGNSLGG